MTGCVFLFFSDGQAGLLIDRFDQRTEEELVRVDVFLASLLFFFLIRNLLGFHAWIIGRWFDVGRSQTWFGCRACVRTCVVFLSFCRQERKVARRAQRAQLQARLSVSIRCFQLSLTQERAKLPNILRRGVGSLVS